MRPLLWLLAAVLLTTALAGCGSDADRGRERNKDKPQAADKNANQ